MDRQQAAEYINATPEGYLQLAKKRVQGRPTYICPRCGNGSGADGTGLTSKDGRHWHCFKCGLNGDMIQIIAEMSGIPDGGSREAFDKAREIYGIDVDNTEHTDYTDITYPARNERDMQEASGTEDQQVVKDYLNQHYYDKQGTQGLSYLKARGISEATAKALRFGYDAARKAVVIPTTTSTGGYSYILRFTDAPIGDSDAKRFSIRKGSETGIFNEAALNQDMPVVICEAALDAASIAEVGGNALGLNSASNAGSFLRKLSQRNIKCKRFIICMDTDGAGSGAVATLFKGLQELSCEVTTLTLPEGYHDANDALRGNRDALSEAVATAVRSFDKEILADISRHKVGNLLKAFDAYIDANRNKQPIKTGFELFDKAIGGGLMPKFYVIGAVTSLGKTTFVLQIADHIAQGEYNRDGEMITAGNDVVIFSLEMAKEDIIARSISRHTWEIATAKPELYSDRDAKTELGIVQSSRYWCYDEHEQQLMSEARSAYEKYAAERISIYEGRYTADAIRAEVERYIGAVGRIPVVIVDYLQIVQPTEALRRATVREQVDYVIDTFTGMRRDLKCPVIGISSFNRSSYYAEADSTAFKESGSIEYSGDCIITLDLNYDRATGKDGDNKNKDRAREAMRGDTTDHGRRDIRLTFQKNRGNRVGTRLLYAYYPMFNFFEELDKAQQEYLDDGELDI